MSQLEHLNNQLTAARANLTQALVDGVDTTEARYTIAHLENEISTLERIAREEAAEIQRVEAASIESVATELAEQMHNAVAAAEVLGLIEINDGEPLPELVRDSAIDHASKAVARAKATLDRAEVDYKPHADKVETLRKRHAEKLAAIEAKPLPADARRMLLAS